jgi:hypothetical protein
METLLIGMDQKIDDLANSIGNCQSNCSGRRNGFDKRMKDLEDLHKIEKGFFQGRKADVALVLGIFSAVGLLLTLYEVFHK